MTRFGTAMVTVLTSAFAVAPIVVETPPVLIWNVSASAPVGLYLIEQAGTLDVPDLVAVMPPEPLAAFLAQRGYLPRGAPMLKRVIGRTGQVACRSGRKVSVDGVEMGEAIERDRKGRSLPIWQGCFRIGVDQLFLMNPAARDSLDSRYFGALPRGSVIGRAIPLYTDEDSDGHFVWRAQTD